MRGGGIIVVGVAVSVSYGKKGEGIVSFQDVTPSVYTRIFWTCGISHAYFEDGYTPPSHTAVVFSYNQPFPTRRSKRFPLRGSEFPFQFLLDAIHIELEKTVMAVGRRTVHR